MTMPIGNIGELVVRGPLVMNGYLNEPATTRNTITPDGWLRTGDLVRRDERVYLYLVDRLKDVNPAVDTHCILRKSSE